jgi:hypothetical protein
MGYLHHLHEIEFKLKMNAKVVEVPRRRWRYYLHYKADIKA